MLLRAPNNILLNCVYMNKDVPSARGPADCDPGSTEHDYPQPRPGPATPLHHVFLPEVHAAPQGQLPSIHWDNSLGNDVDILEEVRHALEQDHSPTVAPLNGVPKTHYGYVIPDWQHQDLILLQQHAVREYDMLFLEPEISLQDYGDTSDEVADRQQQQVRATGKRRPDGWVSKTVQSVLRTTIWPHADLLVACRFDHEPDSSRALDLSPGCHFCRR
jgi:hypothetical protein